METSEDEVEHHEKWLCYILTMVALLGLCPAVTAAEAPVYRLGDKMEDFAVTLSDGAEISLYGLLAQSYAEAKHTAIELTWEYADGTPKQGGESAAAPTDGMGRYEIAVRDESGAPIAEVMLQICGDASCTMAVTDERGVAVHEAARYPYELHVWKVPMGYATDAEAYTMSEEGDSIVITLKTER